MKRALKLKSILCRFLVNLGCWLSATNSLGGILLEASGCGGRELGKREQLQSSQRSLPAKLKELLSLWFSAPFREFLLKRILGAERDAARCCGPRKEDAECHRLLPWKTGAEPSQDRTASGLPLASLSAPFRVCFGSHPATSCPSAARRCFVQPPGLRNVAAPCFPMSPSTSSLVWESQDGVGRRDPGIFAGVSVPQHALHFTRGAKSNLLVSTSRQGLFFY